MLYVVYQKTDPNDAYPVMVGVFLMKRDAESFIEAQKVQNYFSIESVDNVWGYWNNIREKLNEQIYRGEEEYL
jgi:hypothetical protein